MRACADQRAATLAAVGFIRGYCAPNTFRRSGNVFLKSSGWVGDVLTTVSRDPTGEKEDNVTLRRIDEAGQLIQTTSQGGVSFERIFERKK